MTRRVLLIARACRDDLRLLPNFARAYSVGIDLDGQPEQPVAREISHQIGIDAHLVKRAHIACENGGPLGRGELARVLDQFRFGGSEESFAQRGIASDVPAEMIDREDTHRQRHTP